MKKIFLVFISFFIINPDFILASGVKKNIVIDSRNCEVSTSVKEGKNMLSFIDIAKCMDLDYTFKDDVFSFSTNLNQVKTFKDSKEIVLNNISYAPVLNFETKTLDSIIIDSSNLVWVGPTENLLKTQYVKIDDDFYLSSEVIAKLFNVDVSVENGGFVVKKSSDYRSVTIKESAEAAPVVRLNDDIALKYPELKKEFDEILGNDCSDFSAFKSCSIGEKRCGYTCVGWASYTKTVVGTVYTSSYSDNFAGRFAYYAENVDYFGSGYVSNEFKENYIKSQESNLTNNSSIWGNTNLDVELYMTSQYACSDSKCEYCDESSLVKRHSENSLGVSYNRGSVVSGSTTCTPSGTWALDADVSRYEEINSCKNKSLQYFSTYACNQGEFDSNRNEYELRTVSGKEEVINYSPTFVVKENGSSKCYADGVLSDCDRKCPNEYDKVASKTNNASLLKGTKYEKYPICGVDEELKMSPTTVEYEYRWSGKMWESISKKCMVDGKVSDCDRKCESGYEKKAEKVESCSLPSNKKVGDVVKCQDVWEMSCVRPITTSCVDVWEMSCSLKDEFKSEERLACFKKATSTTKEEEVPLCNWRSKLVNDNGRWLCQQQPPSTVCNN